MLTEKELRIIELYRKNIFASYTIREAKKKINTKSYGWVHNAIKKLKIENILKCEEKGNSILCSINLEEQKASTYLSLIEETSSSIKKVPNLKKIMELMPSNFYILLIGGSYADGSFTEKSDIDVIVIMDKKEDRKFLLNKLSNEGDLMIPKLHPYVFTREEFLEMLTNKEENYGKEIAKKHIIISGAEIFYKIVREAIENGFRG